MVKIIQGQLNAEGRKFGIVVSRFNDFITTRLLDGAFDCLRRHGSVDENMTVVWVPGSFEIPTVARKLAESGKYDAIICLAAVIRGGTPHFDYVASEVTKGVAQIGMATGIPTIFGVLTCDTIDEAVERAGTKNGNKGWSAALSAVEMADLTGRL